MPDTSYYPRTAPPTGSVRSSTTLKLRAARIAGHITQAEFQQYRDWYIGLIMINYRTDNLITRRLWAGVRLPLGIKPQKEENNDHHHRSSQPKRRRG